MICLSADLQESLRPFGGVFYQTVGRLFIAVFCWSIGSLRPGPLACCLFTGLLSCLGFAFGWSCFTSECTNFVIPYYSE